MSRYCRSCAKPLKPRQMPKAGKVVTIQVCKSPICKRYNQPQ